MLSQIAAISLVAVLSSCPQQKPAADNLVNTYLIPQGYHGWLVVRNMPNGRPRPDEVTFQFDSKGFCKSDIKLGEAFFATHYFYVDPTGTRTPISEGKDPNQPSLTGTHAWAYRSTAIATSAEYRGEQWDIYFVGTPAEYEAAQQDFGTFMNQFPLYATVEGTKN